MLAMKKLHVDTRVARCSSTTDEEMIRTCIVTNGGFDLLDTVIFNIRKRLAREIMHRAQEVPPAQLAAQVAVGSTLPPLARFDPDNKMITEDLAKEGVASATDALYMSGSPNPITNQRSKDALVIGVSCVVFVLACVAALLIRGTG
eukprot:TRINITY_DN15106_c0_g1_i5.p4 TRINITY_DN15106_c0_g1~~TRINITY_DN15106_c0_g1_i5.p4  ORF type:complete len:146 (-),score=32.86 TRINITY_DN15106_c0_g1_i5:69-506(-)